VESIASFSDFSLSLVALAALIPGIVQAVKELLGWEGTKARALTLFVGMFFGGLFYAADQALIPAAALPWIKLGVFSLMSGPAALGYYSLLFRPLLALAKSAQQPVVTVTTETAQLSAAGVLTTETESVATKEPQA